VKVPGAAFFAGSILLLCALFAEQAKRSRAEGHLSPGGGAGARPAEAGHGRRQ